MTLAHLCSMPGCGRLTTGGRCDAHRIKASANDTAKRQARRVRDGRHTTAWQHTRRAVLAQADHTCTIPGCDAKATHAHYIPHGTHTTNPDDYQAMCAHHHGQHHGRNQRRTA